MKALRIVGVEPGDSHDVVERSERATARAVEIINRVPLYCAMSFILGVMAGFTLAVAS